jgi:AraC-like DNA-binding protein
MKKLIWKKLWRPSSDAVQKEWDVRTGEAVEKWVREKGYLKPLATVEDVAADIGVLPDRLTVWCRIKTGRPVLRWRKELRIEDAKRLLLEFPDLPVSTVGQMVGIDDKSNFKRQFTETVRQTPRQWRESHGK